MKHKDGWIYTFEFGTMRGVPEGKPRWVYRCSCGCGITCGPFVTMAEAEANATKLAKAMAQVDDAVEQGLDKTRH
jgi:hypothetical protein